MRQTRKRDFWRGFGSIVSMRPTTALRKPVQSALAMHIEDSDFAAVGGDFAVVGGDLAKASSDYKRALGESKTAIEPETSTERDYSLS